MENLDKHLIILQRNGDINVWKDADIIAGKHVEKEIFLHLDQAKIILLLISVNFLASDFCYTREMARALQRHQRGEAWVIPILLGLSQWQNTPVGGLQPLPTNGRPVKKWSDPDDAFFDIAQGITRVIKEIRWLEKGASASDIQQFQEALDAYAQVVQINPHSAPAYKAMGDAYSHLKRPDEALSAYQQASQINARIVPTQGNRVSRRTVVIGVAGLVGVTLSAIWWSFSHHSFLSSSSGTSITPGTTSSPGTSITPGTTSSPVSSASVSPSVTSVSPSITSTPASSATTAPTATPVATPSTPITTYSGLLTSDTANQQSMMRFKITSQDLQQGTLVGHLTVDAPLADRGGDANGSIDSDGTLRQLIVSSTVAPLLTFTVETHKNTIAYTGTYDGTTTDSSHNYVEAGTWQMSHTA